MKSILLILLVFVSVTSIMSGLLLFNNPDGETFMMSTSLLKNSPFNDFKIPGLVLATFVGITNLIAVIYYVQLKPERYSWALAGGVMLGGWIIVQIILIRQFSWFQVLYLGTAVGIILLSFHFKVKNLSELVSHKSNPGS